MSVEPAPIGILGGTFDPVHHGHLRLALEVREALGLSEVRLLPSAQTNLRAGAHASAKQRLALLRAALVAGYAGLAVDDREIARGGVSYTIDTLIGLRAEAPTRPLCFIVGMDAWNALPRWHRWEALLDYTHLVVASRPGAELLRHPAFEHAWAPTPAALLDRPAGLVHVCPIPLLPISSTDIRARVADRRSVDGLVPPAVAALIARERLYRVA